MKRKMKKGFLLLMVLLLVLSLIPVVGLEEGTEKTLYFVDDDGNMIEDSTINETITLTPSSVPEDITVPDFEYVGDGAVEYQWYYYNSNTGQYVDIQGANTKNFSKDYLISKDIIGEFSWYGCRITDGTETIDCIVTPQGDTINLNQEQIVTKTAFPGENITYTCPATSAWGELSYRWEDYDVNACEWVEFSQEKTVTLSLGDYHQCWVSDGLNTVQLIVEVRYPDVELPEPTLTVKETKIAAKTGSTAVVEGTMSAPKDERFDDFVFTDSFFGLKHEDGDGEWGCHDFVYFGPDQYGEDGYLENIPEQADFKVDWTDKITIHTERRETEDTYYQDFKITFEDMDKSLVGEYIVAISGAEYFDQGYGINCVSDESEAFNGIEFSVTLDDSAEPTPTPELTPSAKPKDKLEIDTLSKDQQDTAKDKLLIALGKDTFGENTSVHYYNIELINGETGETYTHENFPKDGVDAVIPYPSGMNKTSHSFRLFHYQNGIEGTPIEVTPITLTEAGIQFHVDSLSPFALVSDKIESASEPTPKPESTTKPTGTIDTTETTSPKTGDDSLPIWIPILMMVAAGTLIAVLIYRKKSYRA